MADIVQNTPIKLVSVPTMWTLREAAQYTGLSYDWLRKACLRGELVHIKCGSKFLLNAEKLADYLNSGGAAGDAD